MYKLRLGGKFHIRTGHSVLAKPSERWEIAECVDVMVRNASPEYTEMTDLGFTVDMTLRRADGSERILRDIFALNVDNWRYREHCCEQCEFASVSGGDIVPYGSTTAQLPIGYDCEHDEMEEVEDFWDKTDGGKTCKFFKPLIDEQEDSYWLNSDNAISMSFGDDK